jgi:hypothetical protein
VTAEVHVTDFEGSLSKNDTGRVSDGAFLYGRSESGPKGLIALSEMMRKEVGGYVAGGLG